MENQRYFIFDKFNTWYDWRLICTAKDVTPPEAKTNYVEIDGMNGTLDLSESLTGEVTYNDRIVTASLWTDNGNYAERVNLLRDITVALHGRKVKIIEPDDLEHYFYGRIAIKSVRHTKAYTEFTIEATCEPWRYSLTEISRRVDVNNNSVDVVIVNNGVKSLCPVITVSGNITITHNDIVSTVSTGSYMITSVKLKPGNTLINVTGKGSVTFAYTEGDL